MCQCKDKTELSQTQTKEDVRVADGAVSDEAADVADAAVAETLAFHYIVSHAPPGWGLFPQLL